MLFGSEGADTVNAAGTGPSTIVGGVDSLDGADSLVGGSNNDLVIGNGGNDLINGSGGNDTIVGGAGGDSILTGAGNDNIFGNENNDIINAGEGLNAVVGGLGDDSIVTGAGNDTLIGSEGNDTLAGGAGADRYIVSPGSGNDQVSGFNFSQGDRLSVLGQTFTTQTSADGDVVVVLSGGGRVELNGIASGAFSPSFVI